MEKGTVKSLRLGIVGVGEMFHVDDCMSSLSKVEERDI